MHSNAEIGTWLENYRMCTGKSYGDIFWKSNGSNAQEIFQMFIARKKINLETLLDEYAEDEKKLPEKELSEKWSVMKSNKLSWKPDWIHFALFSIYISKSKTGSQYLDSLDGSQSVTDEGSYQAHDFLMG